MRKIAFPLSFSLTTVFISAVFVFLFVLPRSDAGATKTKKIRPYGTGWDLMASPGAIACRGTTLFMTWPGGQEKSRRILAVIDFSHPEKPVLLGKCPIDGFPRDLAVSGTRVLVVNGRDLLVFDVADPAAPKCLSRTLISADPLRGPAGIDLAGKYIYLACRRDGIRVFELKKAAPPVAIGHTPVPGFCYDVTVDQNNLYAACGCGGMEVLSLKKATQPVRISHLPAPTGVICKMVARGKNLFLAAGNSTVACVSIAQPNAPSWLGSSANLGTLSPYYGAFCFDLAVQSRPAVGSKNEQIISFAANGEAGLIATDVSDPRHPEFLGALLQGVTMGSPYFFTAICLANRFACMNDAWYGLRVLDIANPQVPKLFGPGLKLSTAP